MAMFLDLATCRMYDRDYIKVKETIYKLNSRIRRGDEVRLNELYRALDMPVRESLKLKIFNSTIEMRPKARIFKDLGKFVLIQYKIV